MTHLPISLILSFLLLLASTQAQQFELLGYRYARNAFSVVFEGRPVRANPSDFRVLTNYFAVTSTELFWNGTVVKPGPDMKTFRLVGGFWGVDGNDKVYYQGKLVPGASNQRNQFVVKGDYGTDSRDVFWNGTQLGGATNTNNQFSIKGDYGVDSRDVFYFGKQVAGATNSNGQFVIKSPYACDSRDVFYGETQVKGATNSNGQFVVKGNFGCDSRDVFWGTQQVPGASNSNGQFKNISLNYGYDSRDFFYKNKLVNNVDVGSVSVRGEYATDLRRVFWAGEAINMTASSVQFLNNSYARDRWSVAYEGRQIAGADPNSFYVYANTGYAIDASRVYHNGTVISFSGSSAFRVLADGNYGTDGVTSWWKGIPFAQAAVSYLGDGYAYSLVSGGLYYNGTSVIW